MAKKNDGSVGCLGSLFLLAVSPFTITWRGYVLHVMWAWFISTTFGIKEIGIAQALGLSCVINFLTYQIPPENSNDERTDLQKAFMALLYGVLIPAFALGYGWIIKQFL